LLPFRAPNTTGEPIQGVNNRGVLHAIGTGKVRPGDSEEVPNRKLLVLTRGLLGGVRLGIVRKEAQERQLALRIPTTPIPPVRAILPPWIGLRFSVFPTVEIPPAQAPDSVLEIGACLALWARGSRPA